MREDSFLVGSFQRDSDGKNPNLPKLVKGPDQFLQIVKYYDSIYSNLTVVLTGKRRNFIINKLKQEKINFVYFEMANIKVLNELYNVLDLYVVASRVEGGPQSIVECGLTQTPIISTDVGIASEILAQESIFSMKNFKSAKPSVEIAYNNAKKLTIPDGFNKFIDMFENI